MPSHVSALQTTPSPEESHATGARHGNGAGHPDAITPLAVRVWGEFCEMPGLRLTVRQAARLFSIAHDVADDVLHELRHASLLARSDDGAFFIDR